MWLFLALTFALLALGGYALRRTSLRATEAAARDSAAMGFAARINRSSDEFSDGARSYVATGESASLADYWNALASARARAKSGSGSSLLDLSAPERAVLARAMRESEALVAMETKAMRLVAEARGLDPRSLPPPIAERELTRGELDLQASAKAAAAKELVFGTEYWRHKQGLRRAVDEFGAMVQARTRAAASAALATADRSFALIGVLCALAISGIFAAALLYRRFVSRPLRRYMDTLSGDLPHGGSTALKPEGTFELAALAEAVNERRARRMEAERALRDSELKLRTNLLMMPLAAIEIDAAGRVLTWNPAAELMFDYAESEARGRDIVELIVPERLRGEIRGVLERLNLGEPLERHTNLNLRKDGREIVCEWYNTPLYDSRGAQAGWASIVMDITEQRAEAEKVLYLSRHDPLTGLYNRRSMQERLEEEALRCKRTGARYSTIMLDIDRFKSFNDRHGHQCGDVVLKGVAAAMSSAARSTDWVGRWGGEEFLVLLPETEGPGGLELAEKIRARVEAREMAYGGNSFKVTVTAGVSTGRREDSTVDDCVRRADEALLAGKARGRNRVEGQA